MRLFRRRKQAEPPPPTERILIVDDNEDAAKALAHVLRAEGFEATAVYTGQDAIDLVASERPRAAVVDINLPDTDGYAVARQLRASHGAALLLIALTGYGQPRDRELAAEAGFDHFMVKPTEVDELLRLLRA